MSYDKHTKNIEEYPCYTLIHWHIDMFYTQYKRVQFSFPKNNLIDLVL